MQYSKEVTVGSETYQIQHFNPTTALKILTRLTKTAGPTMAVFTSGDKKANVLEVLPKAIEALVLNIDEEATPALIKDLMGCVFLKGQPIKEQYEIHFQGKLGTLMKLLVEVVKFQYEDFLSVLPVGKNPTTVK